MAVTTTNTSVTYVGSGSVGPFSFNFSISTPSALTVIQGGTVLASTAYTITPVNNNYDNGGLVVLKAPCPVGMSLVLQRITPLTQGSIFYDNLPLPMNQFEIGLDKLTEIVQEIVAQLSLVTATSVVAGTGITVTGTGSPSNPYVISSSGTAQPLTITSFTGGQTGELGQGFTSPTFTDTYTGTPVSGQITNTENIDSPHALSSPFNSATIGGTFRHTTTTNTTFTLMLSDGTSSPSATQQLTWNPRIFGGVAPSGATNSVSASGLTAMLSNGSSLSSVQLGAENVGQTFGPYSPSGQCVYLLLTGGSHTFTDANTGFPFAFNAPLAVSFINIYGITVSMFLYQSTNPLTGTFTPRVAS